MKLKRGLAIFSFILLVGILFSNLASAYYLPPVRNVIESIVQAVVDIFEPALSALFGRGSWNSYLIFEKLLIFLILFSVIYVIITKIPVFEDSPKAVRWIISIIVQ